VIDIRYSTLGTSAYCDDLEECQECGAAVSYYSTLKHTEWHQRQAGEVEPEETGPDRTRRAIAQDRGAVSAPQIPQGFA